jgi:hypothetical protein
MSNNGYGNIHSGLQRHKMQRNTRKSVQGIGCPETIPEIIVPDSGGTGILGRVIRTRGVRKWVQKYLLQTPATQYT